MLSKLIPEVSAARAYESSESLYIMNVLSPGPATSWENISATLEVCISHLPRQELLMYKQLPPVHIFLPGEFCFIITE